MTYVNRKYRKGRSFSFRAKSNGIRKPKSYYLVFILFMLFSSIILFWYIFNSTIINNIQKYSLISLVNIRSTLTSLYFSLLNISYVIFSLLLIFLSLFLFISSVIRIIKVVRYYLSKNS